MTRGLAADRLATSGDFQAKVSNGTRLVRAILFKRANCSPHFWTPLRVAASHRKSGSAIACAITRYRDAHRDLNFDISNRALVHPRRPFNPWFVMLRITSFPPLPEACYVARFRRLQVFSETQRV